MFPNRPTDVGIFQINTHTSVENRAADVQAIKHALKREFDMADVLATKRKFVLDYISFDDWAPTPQELAYERLNVGTEIDIVTGQPVD